MRGGMKTDEQTEETKRNGKTRNARGSAWKYTRKQWGQRVCANRKLTAKERVAGRVQCEVADSGTLQLDLAQSQLYGSLCHRIVMSETSRQSIRLGRGKGKYPMKEAVIPKTRRCQQ